MTLNLVLVGGTGAFLGFVAGALIVFWGGMRR